jgi:hypothetical protein
LRLRHDGSNFDAMLVLLALLELQTATTQLASAQPAPAQSPPAQAVVDGSSAASVSVPPLQEVIKVDGRLEKAVWQRAVRLTGFHQYQPVDGHPAEEVTEVLVWYSPTGSAAAPTTACSRPTAG